LVDFLVIVASIRESFLAFILESIPASRQPARNN
jgi:hypothetical protein